MNSRASGSKPQQPMKPGIVVAILSVLSVAAPALAAEKPNIVIIYADDLGYGEVSAYNPDRNKVPTPRMDAFAAQGMMFTDAHSSSAVCSTSRYALLTGRYHWRSPMGSRIVGVWGAPAIAPDRLTLGGMLREHGYHTAISGKWHLGWDWRIPEGERELMGGPRNQESVATPEHTALWQEVFSREISGGPVDRGFDRYFGACVPNWPPFCYIEDRRTIGIPSEFLPIHLFTNNQASMQGPALEGWSFEPILPAITDRTCEWIEEFAGSDKPFFIYFSMTSPHTPISPNEEWRGRSDLGHYADFVMETDDAIGRVLDALDAAGVAENTLVIITSDNGHAAYAGGRELEEQGHFPSGPLRGYKPDAWEGGHRIPFMIRWPGKVPAGSVSDQLIQQADIFATIAEILGHELPSDAGEDSFSLVPVLQNPDQPVREHAVSQSHDGVIALRKGPWKMIFGPGGLPESRQGRPTAGHLFNLDDDLGETNDLRGDQPGIVAELTALMEEIVANGRSTPGENQDNDMRVDWRRLYRP